MNVVVLNKFNDTSYQLVEQRAVNIETRIELRGTLEAVQSLSEEKTTIESSLKEERLKTDEIKTENESLKVNLQAKKDAEAKAVADAKTKKAQVVETEQAIAPTPAAISGNKQTWLAASGIPSGYWWAVDSIVSGESGWNPSAYNNSSGACGLGQQLPCGKWGGDWKDPVHALRSMNTYVQAYGGWAAAVEFRNCVGWCYSARTGGNVSKDHTWY